MRGRAPGDACLTAHGVLWCRLYMAPPLLPVTRLVVCVACAEHVKVSEDRCPHCGATLPARAGLLARAAIVGVMLVACNEAQPAYGVPETGDPTMTGPTTGNTTGEGPTSTASTGGSGSASSEGESTAAGPTTTGPTTTATGSEGSDTGTGTGTGTGGETDTDTGTATAEPDYGVPMTTTGTI